MAIGSLGWGISGLAKAGYSLAARGNVLGQAALGAGIGYATSDSESPTNRFSDMLRGAAFGGMAGSALHLLKNDITRNMLFRGGMSAARTFGPGAALIVTGGPLWAAKKMIENPLTTVGAAAGMYGIMNADKVYNQFESPTADGSRYEDQLAMRTNLDQQAAALSHLNMGDISPTRRVSTPMRSISQQHRSFMDSTNGLVQGLHNGRHAR